MKQVGTTVKDIANKAEKGEFPGGQVIVYSLKDKGVDLAVTNLSEEGKKAVEDAKAKILDGSVKVPEKYGWKSFLRKRPVAASLRIETNGFVSIELAKFL